MRELPDDETMKRYNREALAAHAKGKEALSAFLRKQEARAATADKKTPSKPKTKQP